LARADPEGLTVTTDSEFDSESAGGEQVNGKQIENMLLSYLVCPTDAGGGFLGAVLVTDYRARPQHFAFVQPVKPTKMQRILYGSTLEEYVKIDVVAYKLWQGLTHKPDVLFVDAAELIAARRISRIPTALIAKIPESEANASCLATIRYDVGPYKDDQNYVGRIVAALETTANLLEPFWRIRQALIEAIKTGS
jgi:hypothetical protein